MLMLAPIALGVLVAFFFASYRASATLRIEDPSAFGARFVPVGWSANETPAQNLADSLSQVVRTAAFQQALSDRLSSSGTISNADELRRTVTSTGTDLNANASGPHLVTLTYTCPRSALCQRVVRDIIDIYRERVAQMQQDQAAAATTFWTGQLRDAQINLKAAQDAVQTYATAHPGATIDGNSSDPQVVQIVNNAQLWRAKVIEAQDALTQANYLGTASARFLQAGTTVVDQPHVTGSRLVGNGTSLVPAALVLVIGLMLFVACVVLLAWVDRTASDPKAVERRLGVPVVATIPKLLRSSGN
jgi:hypothetical protein